MRLNWGKRSTTDADARPLWAPDGSELFYQDTGRLFAVSAQTGPTFSSGTRIPLICDTSYRARCPGGLFG